MAEKAGDVSAVNCKEGALTSKHGHQLFCKYWKSKANDKPKHLIFISHGFGEHCQRYNDFAMTLVQNNNFVFSHDHVGHGKSEGDRVHVTNFSIYVDDVINHIEMVKKEHPGIPCFMFGHSMGGLITILTTLRAPDLFSGIILSGPGIVPNKEAATPFKIFLAKVTATLLPHYEIATISSEVICRNKNVVKNYEEDPLVWHGGIKAKWCCCIMAAMAEIRKRFKEIKVPYLLLHGSADQICSIEGSEMMHANTSSEDKTFKIYESCYHEVIWEIDGQGEQAVSDIVDWINKR
ncbi:hypothetical protein HELRODRAFT_96384 [Helobdella robusta]|uniref:Serine aminopeptidase S33 domain-containing protein n=1 Tax=Helobdella robusta TaxID=6412 RepID=T1G9B7_HELRO|nr:hypothetical protein HELRODRAFT_96384 [Helobdella robusta]ESN91723.1 hypothetical protein HELRODRAFT_96384 [Helobdella robusta]